VVTTPEARQRTRNFARVLGPYVLIGAGSIAMRVNQLAAASLSGFFDNPSLVLLTGAVLLFAGIFIIAFHQYWHSLAAVIISLLGWFIALRGLALLVIPEWIAHVAASTGGAIAWRGLFAFMALCGLYLTYVGWFAKAPEEA
jgi:hypothetical protein